MTPDPPAPLQEGLVLENRLWTWLWLSKEESDALAEREPGGSGHQPIPRSRRHDPQTAAPVMEGCGVECMVSANGK
jgi:hypothetical protein